MVIGMRAIKTAVIGTGYLGKFHVEKFASLPHSNLCAICDIDETHAAELSEKFNVPQTRDYRSLVDQVEAVSIVTPTPSHFEIAHFFLSHGIHVFVEKPITVTVAEANQLIVLAKQKGVILQVGHVERFNPAFQFIKPLLTVPRFIETQRLTSFKLRGSDVSVILDLMIHDIDLVLAMTKANIVDIRATGACVLTPFIDIANARIEFDNGCVASITASRINTHASRRLRIFQTDCYLYADLQRCLCRLRKKSDTEMFPGVPNIIGEEHFLEKSDALKSELNTFLESVRQRTQPIVDGFAARDALAIALKITDIVHHNNAIIT